MGISHVIRGVEWLPSTPKHVLLYKMFELDPPTFAHIPLLIHKSGAKLSKRHGDMSVNSYKNRGYLPETIINGLALLGWTPSSIENLHNNTSSTSEFSKLLYLSDLESCFNLEKIGKSPWKFEEQNFRYLNSQHIRRKFSYSSPSEKQFWASEFREVLINTLPHRIHCKINDLSESKLCHIMDIMVPRILFYSDLK